MSAGGRVLVIGGGLSGLVCAHELMKRGREVLVLESSGTPGGVVRTLEREGFLLELGPHTVRPTAEIVQLCRELGIEKEILFSDPRLPRYVEIGGRLRKIPFGPLSPGAVARAAGEIFVRRGRVPEETAFDFVRRRFGRRVAQNLLEPFVAGIFAGDAKRLSMADAFPVLRQLERDYRSVLRGLWVKRRMKPPGDAHPGGLLSFEKGLGRLPEALAARLRERFCPDARVEKIERLPSGWGAVTATGSFEASNIVLAVPHQEAARLCASLAPEASRALSEIPAPPLCVVHCAWRRTEVGHSLRGFGHLVAPEGKKKVLGAVWSSSLFPGRAPEGELLLAAFLGGRRTPENASLPDAEVQDVIYSEMEKVLRLRQPPRILRKTLYSRAIPQYERGHAGRMAALGSAEQGHPGLYFRGNYRGGISVGDVVRNALMAASDE